MTRFRKFRDNPAAIWPYVWKNIYGRLVADSCISWYKDIRFLNYQETLDHVIDNNLSLIRFGDGTPDYVLGIGIYFNDWKLRYFPALAERIKEVLATRDPRLLICVNAEFIQMNKQDFLKKGIGEQWQFWINSKIQLKKYLDPKGTYGSALVFHTRYNPNLDFGKLKQFFSDKHVIIVTSNIQRFKDLRLGVSTDFVSCPANDSWLEYERIKADVRSVLREKNYDKGKTLALVSMSEVAKPLVFDLTVEDEICAWDTGQFFDLAAKEISK